MRFWNFEKQKNSWIELNKSLKDHRLIKLGDEKDSQFSYLILYTFIFSLIHISFNNNFTYLSLISKSILFSFIFFCSVLCFSLSYVLFLLFTFLFSPTSLWRMNFCSLWPPDPPMHPPILTAMVSFANRKRPSSADNNPWS